MMSRGLAALLLSAALVAPHVSALAQMTTNASNAVLPAARNNLGLPTNWVRQYHQNGGGTATGHNLA